LVEAAVSMVTDAERRQRVVEAQRLALDEHHRAARVARAYEGLYAELLARVPQGHVPTPAAG
jgi:hypothetical protein